MRFQKKSMPNWMVCILYCDVTVDTARKFINVIKAADGPVAPRPESSPDYGKEEVMSYYVVIMSGCGDTSWLSL